MDVVAFIGVLILTVAMWVGRRKQRRRRRAEEERWTKLERRLVEIEHTVWRLKSSAAVQETPPETVVPGAPERPAERVSAESAAVSSAAAGDGDRARSGLPHIAEIPAGGPVRLPVPPVAVKPEVPWTDRVRSALDLEEALGTNWLNKIGVVILVLGVAFFLAYQLKTLGPAGKVLVGYAAAGAMLGGGIYFERRERYRILARAGVGGGWALLFFTTYAMYHVPAAQVLQSQAADLMLMLAVASAMVWHTLRYRSQVVTGLAFLLAFLTVTVSHTNVYSLSAGVVLAGGMVVIACRMRWFELEVFGIVASYLNHFLWLRPLIAPMGGHHRPFPEFTASAGILVTYWLIFRGSYVVRRPVDEKQERVSTIAALLNSALLLALLKYQSVHPEWAFWALLAIGAVETALAQLPVTRRRRTAVVVLSTLGVVLLIAAFPFRYSGTRLSVLWLLEAEALLLIGVWTGEVVFRRLGMLAAGLVAGQVVAQDGARLLGRRMDGADLSPDFAAATIFAAAGAVFYANAHWVSRRWAAMFEKEFDRVLVKRLSYVAALMFALSAWSAFAGAWTAVAWSALGLALAYAGARWKSQDLTYQANVISGIAVLRALLENFDLHEPYHGVSLRLITVGLTAGLLYAAARFGLALEAERGFTVKGLKFEAEGIRSAAYTWAATFLLALLAWYELRPAGVAVAWTIGGLGLLEMGVVRKSLGLRMQAYLLFAASFVRIFFVNVNATGGPGEISPRFYTMVPVMLAFLYGYGRLGETESLSIDRGWKAAETCCYMGVITVVALMRFELGADWVAPAWAALVLALMAVAWRSGRRIFLHQALLISVALGFRTSLHNLYERSYFPAPAWESRMVTVGMVVLFLFAALPIAFRLRMKGGTSQRGRIGMALEAVTRRPEQVLFFLAVGLLSALLALEMRHGMVTLAWGVEGVAVFLMALWLGERSYRLTGLGLLLLCVAKILLVDVWRLNPRDRYLTFMVLGGALLLVSYLYTRNREALRQYL